MSERTLRRAPLFALVLSLFMATLFFLWPEQLGGRTTYVATRGLSMEPRFHTGDLAVLRAGGSYRVGDVVAYRSASLHSVVMHRIVSIANGHYTFKGDNNSWLDPVPATSDQLLGKLAVRIPRGGVILKKAAIVVPSTVIALLLLGGGTAAHRKSRRRHPSVARARHAAPHPGAAARWSARVSTASVGPNGVAVTASALVVMLLGLFWTAPAGQSAPPAPPNPRHVTFSYSASVPTSAAYDSTNVSSPDPIFRRVTNDVRLKLDYTGTVGTVAVNALLATSAGWRSTVPLLPETAITSSPYTTSVSLDLNSLSARADAAAAVIGVTAGTVDLTVQASFQSPDRVPFMANLELALTSTQLRLANQQSLTASEQLSASAASGQPPAFSFMGHNVSQTWMKALAMLAILLAIVSAAVIGMRVRQVRGASEIDNIKRRYASMLIPVEPLIVPRGRPIVDVAEMPTLVKLAERYGLLVLHWERSGIATYVVQDESTTYRYRTTAPGIESDLPARHRADETTDHLATH